MSEVTYTLTRAEITQGLCHRHYRTHLVKSVVQVGLLILLGVAFVFPWGGGEVAADSRRLAVLFWLLAAAVAILPLIHIRREAADMAPLTVTVWLSADRWQFQQTVQPITESDRQITRSMVIWQLDSDRLVLLPRRAFTPQQWQWMTAD